MSFFSDIEKELNNFAANIDQKLSGKQNTNDPEIDAIKAEIEGYSAEISKDIIELGKVALAKFESGVMPDETSAPIYNRIKSKQAAAMEAEARIARIEEERKAAEMLNKERICSNCGKVCPAGMSFCGYCGSSLAGAKPVEAAKSEPVEEVVPDAVVVETESEPIEPEVIVEISEPVEMVQEPASVPEHPVCPSCGAEIKGNIKFCRECGTKLGTEPEKSAQTAAAYKICPGCGAQLAYDKKFCSRCGAKQ